MIWKHSPVVTTALKRDDGRASTGLPGKVGRAETGRIFRVKQNEQKRKDNPQKTHTKTTAGETKREYGGSDTGYLGR